MWSSLRTTKCQLFGSLEPLRVWGQPVTNNNHFRCNLDYQESLWGSLESPGIIFGPASNPSDHGGQPGTTKKTTKKKSDPRIIVVQVGATKSHFGIRLGLPRPTLVATKNHLGSILGAPRIILAAPWDHQSLWGSLGSAK